MLVLACLFEPFADLPVKITGQRPYNRDRASSPEELMSPFHVVPSMTETLAIGLGTQELLIIGVILLLLFGGTKIPSLMRGLGRGMGEFKKGVDEGKAALASGMNNLDDDEPTTTRTETVEKKVPLDQDRTGTV